MVSLKGPFVSAMRGTSNESLCSPWMVQVLHREPVAEARRARNGKPARAVRVHTYAVELEGIPFLFSNTSRAAAMRSTSSSMSAYATLLMLLALVKPLSAMPATSKSRITTVVEAVVVVAVVRRAPDHAVLDLHVVGLHHVEPEVGRAQPTSITLNQRC